MSHVQHRTATDQSETGITLAGFYITPFGKKTVAIEGTGATKSVEKTVDFDAVVAIVKECITKQTVAASRPLA